MQLKQVTIEGFRTFNNYQVVTLPDGPGLYLMRGDNQLDSALAGNDVGKSTFWDAVYWGLYGETTRGLRASNIVSWGAKSAFVEQRWELDGLSLIISRQQNPNKVIINGKLLETNLGDRRIEKLLGFSGTEFLHSVLVGQFADYFLDLGPTEKLSLFCDVLALNRWDRCSDRAKEKGKVAEKAYQSWTDQLNTLKGRLDGTKEQLTQLQESSDRWDEENKNKRSQLKEEIATIKEELQIAIRKEANLDQKVVILFADQVTLEKEINELQSELNSLDVTDSKLTFDLKNRRCPFCNTKLSESWRDSIEDELHKIKQTRKKIAVRLRSQQQELQSVSDKHATVKHTLSNIVTGIRDLEEQLRVKRALLKECRENPYIKDLISLEEQLTSLKKRRVFLTNKQELAEVEQKRYEYWVKGFRDLRLWLMDSALSELEMRINSGLIALGLERWGINLAIERENKSGGITRGFTTQVHSPESAGDTPWRSWGGGVTQRLKIAGEIGVSKLIQDRKGIDCGIEVWDEPTAHLSDHGVQDLLIHLQERSREEKKQIWVTDHRVFDFAFDGGLLVEKSSSGSLIKLL